MTGKKIIFYILAASIAGTFALLYIQYNSSKNITALIDGNQKYLDEYKINADLKELEKDVVMIESNISNVISTDDSIYLNGMGAKMAKVQIDLNRLQQVADDSVTVKEIDDLDTVVKSKINFSKKLLDSFSIRGKNSAERMIGTLRGKKLMDSIYFFAQNIENSRHAVIARLTASNIKSGQKALRFNTILIVLVLVFGAGLFWYIINIIQQLIQSEKKVKESAQVKENFMANMSHEIRTPMNAILGFTNLLQRKSLDNESKGYVQTIQKSGENLLTIINDILDLSKIEAGMMRIESAPFSIRGLLHSVETMFKSKANEKEVQLTAEVEDSLPDTLDGDATRLTQILVNLIGNSLKFTSKGNIKIRITNEGKQGNTIITGITITDTGIGIEKGKLNHIFERFQQADDAVTRKFGGTGLGLSIVNDLVLLQQGTINVVSEPGKGATFKLTIPYTISNEDFRNSSLPKNSTTISTDFKFIKVLVAEDNEINQSLIKHLFTEWNLEYDLVNNGYEAIEILKKNKYSLILMDIQMPVMDGYTAAREIREKLKIEIPIIAMTAHAFAGEREKCISFGMNEYISKPIREEQLHQVITQFTQNNKPVLLPTKAAVKSNSSTYSFIDLAYMREISGGNTVYEKTVTEQFIEAIPEDLAAIEKAWQTNDISQLRQLAHNMKTTVSVMGLNEKLQPFLDTLEYENLTEEIFQLNFLSVTSICNEALAEATQFYVTF